MQGVEDAVFAFDGVGGGVEEGSGGFFAEDEGGGGGGEEVGWVGLAVAELPKSSSAAVLNCEGEEWGEHTCFSSKGPRRLVDFSR